MAEILHPRSSETKGPFLIDRSQLEKLHDQLQDQWLRLESKRESDLAVAIEEKFKSDRARSWNKDESPKNLKAAIKSEIEGSYKFEKERMCIITLKGGSAIRVEDLGEALRDPALQDKEPSGFLVTMQNCRRKVTVNLDKRWGNELTVAVEPQEDQLVQECLVILRNWQNDVAPSIWQKCWRLGVGVVWFAWFLAITFGIQYLANQQKTIAKEQFQNEAFQLITNGVPTAKQGRALELLLSATFDYKNPTATYVYPNWYLALLCGGLLYCVAISFPPSVAIGIGLGERRVRFWRGYSRFVLITTPTFIFAIFFWPKIVSFLQNLF